MFIPLVSVPIDVNVEVETNVETQILSYLVDWCSFELIKGN